MILSYWAKYPTGSARGVKPLAPTEATGDRI